MHTRLAPILTMLVLAAAAAGCTSFATVRSARVLPGSSVTVQGSITTPPGDDVAWFYSLDCTAACDHAIVSPDVSWTYGTVDAHPYSLGVGVNGFLFPYVDVYTQLNADSARAFGVGARLGVPLLGWSHHQVYGRLDIPMANGRRLLWNPGLFAHFGNSPNGENPGHFFALVNGVGLEQAGERATWVPAVAVVVARGQRESYGLTEGPFTTVFGAASLSVTFHRRRSDAARR
jgi:hypothetical protein